ncbi:uncharacterized protein LOC106640769 [Copidosoma floridanum]|uniref:uncharacterized protein LOC106640769 n=1 Tax=Copidosoma floridanum TaxID=29053 RepID=UPI000C6F84A8|nr:uncharacterized protein LOC106640769 [Copidosoma floridanum]
MEPQNTSSKTVPASTAINRPDPDQNLENRQLEIRFRESPTCISEPKLQIQEMVENIRLAETNYNSVQRLCHVKASNFLDDENSSSTAPSRKSSSSLGCSSDSKYDREMQPTNNFRRNEREANNNNTNSDSNLDDDDDDEDEDEDDNKGVQIMVTPRSQIVREPVAVVTPRLEKSAESVKKRLKKTIKPKKKPAPMKKPAEDLARQTRIYTAKAKRKKLHGRLRNSNSKSTVITRDTIMTDARGLRMRKTKRQKSIDALSVVYNHTQQQQQQQQQQQSRKRGGGHQVKTREPNKKRSDPKDFIEIFNNSRALKSGSLSAVSSRPSKIEASHQVSYLSEEIAQTIGDARNNWRNKKLFAPAEDNATVDVEFRGKNVDNPGKSSNDRYQVNEEGPRQSLSQVYSAVANNHLVAPHQTPHYETPTYVSDKKRVPKPLYQRFSIRSIPFVVGTSLSPSHNLGLNIQQVLGVIKMKQPAVPGISPVLIRKVSKGMSPVSRLFEEINSEFARSCRDFNFHDSTTGYYDQRTSNLGLGRDISSYSCGHLQSPMANQMGFKQSNNVTCEPLYEEDEELHSSNSETCVGHNGHKEQIAASDAGKLMDNLQQQRNRSLRHPSRVQSVGDHSFSRNNYPRNNKEMMEVLNRFHDQFQKMITQQEKLKEQLEKRKDKSVLKEVFELEEALRAKEKEIKAVVDLYKEVISLKQQMKLLHERNSFVCIARPEDSLFHQTTGTMRARAHTALPFEGSGLFCEATPHSLQLTGLLRQIQAFHRQLSLA